MEKVERGAGLGYYKGIGWTGDPSSRTRTGESTEKERGWGAVEICRLHDGGTGVYLRGVGCMRVVGGRRGIWPDLGGKISVEEIL